MANTTLVLHIFTIGGSCVWIEGHSAFMAQNGIELCVAANGDADLHRFARDQGIRAYPVHLTRRITPLRDIYTLLQLVTLIRRVRPSLVDLHTPKAALLGALAAAICNVPTVHHMHGLPHMSATGFRKRLLTAAERTICRLSQRVICVSPSLRDAAVRENLCPADKAVVLHHGSSNGVDSRCKFNPLLLDPDTRVTIRRRFHIDPNASVLGYCGRFAKDKGITELAAAWQVLRARHPNAELILVGKHDSSDPVDPEVMDWLHRDPRVHFTGWVENIRDYLLAMDILVHPAYREGFGVVLAEANAMNVPVVATRIPGCVDAVADGETALLVSPRDVPSLTAAIESYLADSELARSHGRAGRARVLELFEPHEIRNCLLAEYRSIWQGTSVDNARAARKPFEARWEPPR